jgi:hypothetical protein
MADKPRVTRFQIDWTPASMQSTFQGALEEQQQEQQQQQQQYSQQEYQQQQHLMSGGMPVPPMYGSGNVYEQPHQSYSNDALSF